MFFLDSILTVQWRIQGAEEAAGNGGSHPFIGRVKLFLLAIFAYICSQLRSRYWAQRVTHPILVASSCSAVFSGHQDRSLPSLSENSGSTIVMVPQLLPNFRILESVESISACTRLQNIAKDLFHKLTFSTILCESSFEK